MQGSGQAVALTGDARNQVYVAYLCFFILGACILLPWNSEMVAGGYVSQASCCCGQLANSLRSTKVSGAPRRVIAPTILHLLDVPGLHGFKSGIPLSR